jgi:hypothetical protein
VSAPRRAVLIGVALTVVASALAAQAATRTASPPAATFGTPVVVDPFRPGYEPDLAINTAPRATAARGSTFVSMPNGFSTTMSYIWRSDDNRRSFHLVEGQVAGKPETCIGGGDTELKLDPVNGTMYFADLQGLTNFSTSTSSDGGRTWDTTCTGVPGAGVDRQWYGIDSNAGKSPVGDGADGGRIYLDYDNVGQDLSTGGNNQLVMNESVDGVHFGAQCAAAGLPCPAPPAVITTNESIPGNVVVDNTPGGRFQHRVYAIHTGDNGNSVIVSWCSGKKGDRTAAQVADSCTDPTQVSDPVSRVNVNWHDSAVRPKGKHLVGQLFPALAVDTAGNLYATWSEYPGSASYAGPGTIFLAVSRDGARTWSAPVRVSPPGQQNTVMPWIVAGSRGRIGIAWYGSPTGREPGGQWGPDYVEHALWNVYYATSLDALSRKPSFALTRVSDHPVKYGSISTGGLGGSQDRSLGDFFQVQTDALGRAVIAYVDDTSADRNQDTCGGCGQTPAEAAGPVMVAAQSGGPSLYAGKRIPTSRRAMGAVRERPGDAFLSLAGQDIAAPPALDVIGASVRRYDARRLAITLTTADKQLADHLAPSPSLGGAVNTWMVRWAAPSYHRPGDGNQLYVGMQSVGGGAPSFYLGSTQAITTTHAKYFTYPATTTIPGAIHGPTITWIVPLTAIGSPLPGQGLFSITAFTSTQATPSAPATFIVPNQGGEIGDENLPNLISAASPFTYVVGRR